MATKALTYVSKFVINDITVAMVMMSIASLVTALTAAAVAAPGLSLVMLVPVLLLSGR